MSRTSSTPLRRSSTTLRRSSTTLRTSSTPLRTSSTTLRTSSTPLRTSSTTSSTSRGINCAPHARPRPLRPLADRPPPRRRRAHGHLQLALRPPPWRHVHPPRRGHGRRALHAPVRGDGPRRSALARPAVGGGAGRRRSPRAVPAVGARRALRRGRAGALGERRRLPLLLHRGRAGAQAPARRGRAAAAALRRHVLPPHAAAGLHEALDVDAVRAALPRAGRRRRHHRRSDPRRGHVAEGIARRLHPRPLRRPADVQLLRRCRRSRDGDHARHPRRGASDEHASPGADLPRPRMGRAALRARLAHPRAGPHQALQAARRDLGVAVRRGWVLAGGDGQLPHAPRLVVAGRPRSLRPRLRHRELLPRPRQLRAGGVRPAEARLAQWAVHSCHERGGAAAARGAARRRRRAVARGGDRAGEEERAPADAVRRRAPLRLQLRAAGHRPRVRGAIGGGAARARRPYGRGVVPNNGRAAEGLDGTERQEPLHAAAARGHGDGPRAGARAGHPAAAPRRRDGSARAVAPRARRAMYRLIRQLLFALDAETAHEFTAAQMVRLQRIPLALRIVEAFCRVPARPTHILGLTFKTPIGIAFVEVGTVTPRPQPGNPRPRLFRDRARRALVNRMGFNNDGADAIAPRLIAPVPLFVNIGKNKTTPLEAAADDYAVCAAKLGPHADAIVINVSSPNTPALRDLQRPEHLERILDVVRHERVFVKIAPDLDDGQLAEISDVCVKHAHGMICTNTTMIDEGGARRAPLPTNATTLVGAHGVRPLAGGPSRAPLMAKSTEILAKVRARVGRGYPLIGVGGIFTAEDVHAKMAAGAGLVQLYTGFIYEGPSLPSRLARALR